MNYAVSKRIWAELEDVERVVISLHIEPDLDSIGSALALKEVLVGLGKNAEVVCFDKFLKRYDFFKDLDKVKEVKNRKFSFEEYDLYFALDSSSWSVVSKEGEAPSGIRTVVIDHHQTNKGWGDVNLIDVLPSTAEILYGLFCDWGIKIDGCVATNLLAGIIGDTGCFRYPNTRDRTHEIAGELMRVGANSEKIIGEVFQTKTFGEYKYWEQVLARMEFDRETGILWSAIPHRVYEEYWRGEVEGVAGMFFQQVEGSRVGVYMTEEGEGVLTVSFRARDKNVDVSEIAVKLGGGGHKTAAGARLMGMEFDEAVRRVLQETKNTLIK